MKSSVFKNAQMVEKKVKTGGMDEDAEMEDEGEAGGVGSLGSSGLVLTTCFKLAVNPDPRLTTGCDMLTDFYRGGFVPKKLYEIYGESGAGKT